MTSIADLITEIRAQQTVRDQHTKLGQEAFAVALLAAKKQGDALERAKSLIGHGQWAKWLQDNFDKSQQWAGELRAISRQWEAICERYGKEPHVSVKTAAKYARSQETQDDGPKALGTLNAWFRKQNVALSKLYPGPFDSPEDMAELSEHRRQLHFEYERRLKQIKPRTKSKAITLTKAQPMFYDSGAFSLLQLAKKNPQGERAFYASERFNRYLEDYVRFVKRHENVLAHYANVDAIGHPDLTWDVQERLEMHGLSPVPVIHFGTDMKWLRHYLDNQYGFIALGGLVGAKKKELEPWLDACFDLICDTPNRLPRVKVHGFGLTSPSLVLRYPWWSVDSTSWVIGSKHGNIFVPRRPKRCNGEYDYSLAPHRIHVGGRVEDGKSKGRPTQLTPKARTRVKRWLRTLNVTLDEVGTSYNARAKVNQFYFLRLEQSLPAYPTPFLNPSNERVVCHV